MQNVLFGTPSDIELWMNYLDIRIRSLLKGGNCHGREIKKYDLCLSAEGRKGASSL